MILLCWIPGMLCIEFLSKKKFDLNSHENYKLQAHKLIGVFTKLYGALGAIVGEESVRVSWMHALAECW
jgi:hypothetical protein